MANVTYTIREAVPDDAESYNAFTRQIADEPNNGVLFHAGEFTATVEETRERLTRMHERDNCAIFVAVDDANQVIGESTGSTSERLARRHSVGIGITVGADYRGQGIGTALMQAMVAWAEANPVVHRLELEVFTTNYRAIHLYLKLGFVIEGTRYHVYRKYGHFKDTYIMALLFEGKA